MNDYYIVFVLTRQWYNMKDWELQKSRNYAADYRSLAPLNTDYGERVATTYSSGLTLALCSHEPYVGQHKENLQVSPQINMQKYQEEDITRNTYRNNKKW